MSIDNSGDKNTKHPPTNSAVSRRNILLTGTSAIAAAGVLSAAQVSPAHAQQPPPPASSSGQRPNIVVIMGDDIGIWNLGAYHRGMMAGRTPNLDKIAAEG